MRLEIETKQLHTSLTCAGINTILLHFRVRYTHSYRSELAYRRFPAVTFHALCRILRRQINSQSAVAACALDNQIACRSNFYRVQQIGFIDARSVVDLQHILITYAYSRRVIEQRDSAEVNLHFLTACRRTESSMTREVITALAIFTAVIVERCILAHVIRRIRTHQVHRLNFHFDRRSWSEGRETACSLYTRDCHFLLAAEGGTR